MTDLDLIRFIDAQARVFPSVLKELREGRKSSHWMWFVFPQWKGLGQSPTAQYYAIQNLDQARRYLSDSILGKRLIECVRIMIFHKDKTALEILGTPDDYKFRSCVTLFREVAGDFEEIRLFTLALDKFYGGQADPITLHLLA